MLGEVALRKGICSERELENKEFDVHEPDLQG